MVEVDGHVSMTHHGFLNPTRYGTHGVEARFTFAKLGDLSSSIVDREIEIVQVLEDQLAATARALRLAAEAMVELDW